MSKIKSDTMVALIEMGTAIITYATIRNHDTVNMKAWFWYQVAKFSENITTRSWQISNFAMEQYRKVTGS